jgi:glycosyltransferase involved in cell wall biosynthesis
MREITTKACPKVSVCVVAYNHENFIGECLQSLVKQQTDFYFEIIVGDDASCDRTVEIIHDFQEKYPQLIRLIRHERNIGPTANYLSVHSAARGEYIAHIDGDDCALPGKLQAQVDVLDRHPDVAFAVHAVRVMNSVRVKGRTNSCPVKATLEDLLMLGTYFVHSSVMYRKHLDFQRKQGREMIDFLFHVERASTGSIFFDDRVLGCYRVHANGVSQSLERRALIEQLYGDAFERAIELGANPDLVHVARLKRKMSFAIDSLRMGDERRYKEKILLTKQEEIKASWKHIVLSRSRMFPFLVRFYLRLSALRLR